MFDHVTIRVSDMKASERFYETVLGVLGIEKTWSDDDLAEWGDFSIVPASSEQPMTRGLHVGFSASSRVEVDELWRVGTDGGYRDDGAPGPRLEYSEDYYGAFLLDPDGNSAEAVQHGKASPGIDHLWMRVSDVAASTQFYETVAPFTGFAFRGLADNPERARFAGPSASFSVVRGQPTEHLHVAFPATSNETVAAFHAAALAAGYRDNGVPGERPIYHEGYYGAFVLDPDGSNVEVVCHNRAEA